jgi:septal ring factor EnvC (AmiA/AmiB activator)
MSARLAVIGSLFLALLSAQGPAVAQTPNRVSDRHRQKQVAEQERAELRKKLSDLKEDIVRTEKARGDAADALARKQQSPTLTAHCGNWPANRNARSSNCTHCP